MLGDAVEAGGRARAAQGEVERPGAFQPVQPPLPLHHQRMLEQSEQRHRRELLRRGRGEGEQQGAGGELRQRPAGAVVRFDPPAAQMGRDAAGEVAVGSDQGGGSARDLQGLAQGDGDRLRLLGGIGELQRPDSGEPAVGGAERLPAVGEGGRLHRIGDRPAPGGRSVAPAAPAPPFDLAAADSHPVEEQLQVELRMGLDRAAAQARGLVRLVRAERIPFVRRHVEVEAGKDDQPVVEAGDDPKQPGDGGRRAGDSGGGDEARRRRLAPAFGDGGEQAVAAVGEVDPAALGEQPGPLVEYYTQSIERFLPVEREVGQVGGEAAQAGGLDLLDEQLVERPGEILGEPERLRRLDSGEMALDQPGEQEQPLDRLDRGRDVLPVPERLERAADPLVELRIADRDEPRQEQPAAGAPDEGVGDRPGGAVVGDEDDSGGEPGVAAAVRAIRPAASASAKARCGGMV